MDVTENVSGEPPRRILADLLEDRVAEVVRKYSGEARRRISRDQPRDDFEGRLVARHSVDHGFVGERHQKHRGLPASTSTSAATTRNFSSGWPLGQSIGRNRQSAPNPLVPICPWLSDAAIAPR